MSNLREIKRRINTISSIAHVTDALQKISAARLIKAKKRAHNFKKYIHAYSQIVSKLIKNKVDHTLLKPVKSDTEIIIIITQDKGLCGSFHTSVIKKSMEFIKEKNEKEMKLIVCGKKGIHYYEKSQYPILLKKTNIPVICKEEDITDIIELVKQDILKKNVSAVHIVYNEFISTTKYEPQIKQLFPIVDIQDNNIENTFYLFEPNPLIIIDFIIPKYLSYLILDGFLESSVSEHTSRMIMMERASKNANEMIDQLTNLRNKKRQAMITSELSEIVSTIEALS